MKYPYDVDDLREELKDIRSRMKQGRREIEQYLGIPTFSIMDMEDGHMLPEESAFRDYADYIRQCATAQGLELSSNFNIYILWETHGWTWSKHRLAINILEKQIDILENMVDSADTSPEVVTAMTSIQESIAALRHDEAEHKGET